MVRITTTNSGVIESQDSFATIQTAIKNNTFIEVNSGGKRHYINPKHIVSLEGDAEAARKPYQNPGANNFPFPMTKEETEAMQNKLQPLKAIFDQKKQAMEEMAQKEKDKLNSAYETMYGRFRQNIEEVNAPVPEVVAEAPVESSPVAETTPKVKAKATPKVK
jgi:hypothetical protein